MILCVCRAVQDRVVGAAIVEGASTLDEIVAACAAGSDCGACHVSLLDMLVAAARCAPRQPRLGTPEPAATGP